MHFLTKFVNSRFWEEPFPPLVVFRQQFYFTNFVSFGLHLLDTLLEKLQKDLMNDPGFLTVFPHEATKH